MHIPKGASQTCALLTFDDALHCSQHDDYDAARWLYEIGRASCRERVYVLV